MQLIIIDSGQHIEVSSRQSTRLLALACQVFLDKGDLIGRSMMCRKINRFSVIAPSQEICSHGSVFDSADTIRFSIVDQQSAPLGVFKHRRNRESSWAPRSTVNSL